MSVAARLATLWGLCFAAPGLQRAVVGTCGGRGEECVLAAASSLVREG